MRNALPLALASILAACGSSSTEETSGDPPPDPEPTTGTETTEAPPEDDTEVWTVAAELVDCEGEGPMRCMRTRRAPDGEWELFYDAIEGFTHEEGTEYDVRVRVTEVEDPPADGSSLRVELVEVIAERPVESAGCTSNDDCGEGEMCTGDVGCDEPWTCQPMRPCTRDLRPYCTCDGRTVRGSGSCPPEPFRSRGPCE